MKLPEAPEGLQEAMWFDLSPLRPDEYDAMNANRWTEAVQLRNAYQTGLEDAANEAKAREQAEKMWSGE